MENFDLFLNHQGVNDAHESLVQAGNMMSTAMEDCIQSVTAAQAELEGEMKSSATTLFNTLQSSNQEMTGDIQAAAGVLKEMQVTISEADHRAAVGIAAHAQ